MNFKLKAASFFLCNDNVEEALNLLENSESIPDEVIVFENFQHEPVENLLSYIDDIATMLRDAYIKGSVDTGFILRK